MVMETWIRRTNLVINLIKGTLYFQVWSKKRKLTYHIELLHLNWRRYCFFLASIQYLTHFKLFTLSLMTVFSIIQNISKKDNTAPYRLCESSIKWIKVCLKFAKFRANVLVVHSSRFHGFGSIWLSKNILISKIKIHLKTKVRFQASSTGYHDKK